MNEIETIKSFAREWINGNGRTPDRKRLIVATYQQLFNERLRTRCSTCLIEAIFRIINHKPMENKCHFRLRKGAILQPFGGGIITNDNLTDEIAFECLRTGAANPSMFSVMPEIPMDDARPDLEIVPAGDETNPETTVEQIAGDVEPEIVHEKVVDVPVAAAADLTKSKPKPNRPKTYKSRKK
jgi:hypothetical protein